MHDPAVYLNSPLYGHAMQEFSHLTFGETIIVSQINLSLRSENAGNKSMLRNMCAC